MPHQNANDQVPAKVTITGLIIVFLILFYACKTNSRVESDQPLSEADLVAEDYIEPGIKWGYVDKSGEVIINEQFDDCRDFAFGLAAAAKKSLWGYIDHQGAWVVKPLYRGAWTFQNGRGRVKVLNGKYGYLNNLGALVIDTIWEDATDFQGGYAKVKINDRIQYIDSSGHLISDDSWDQGFAFQDGYARISNGGWWGLLNKQGVITIKPIYDALGELKENRLPIQRKNYWGYTDTSGIMMIIPQYEQVTPFQNGIAAVKNQTNWGLIDFQGNLIKALLVEEVMSLGANRWSAYKQDSFALFNNQGIALTPFNYSQINKFSEGLAVFGKDGYFGYMDTLGQHIIPNLILLAWDFKNGAARYTVGEGIGFINITGKALHENLFPDVRDYFEGLAKVQTVGR